MGLDSPSFIVRLRSLFRPPIDRFRHLVERSAEGMVVVDEGGVIRFMNAAAHVMLGDRIVEGRPFGFARRPGAPFEFERTDSEHGTKRYEVRMTDIEWDGKRASLATLHDMTLVQKMDALKARLIEHQRSDEIKDEFVSTVSHEMRTPLTIVKGAVSNLQVGMMGALNDKQKRVIDIASANIDRLARIINDLLDLSRLESGKSRINLRSVNLGEAVTAQAHHFGYVPHERKIDIVIDIPENLPKAYADHDMIDQVLVNVLGNAFRFAQSQVGVRLQFPAHPLQKEVDAQAFLQVSVSNDGPPIEEDKITELFNKFTQLGRKPGGEGYRGTGLGLAICKEIILRHGGQIWCENGPTGPVFHFMVPVYDRDRDILRLVQSALDQSVATQAPLSVIVLSIRNMPEILRALGPVQAQEDVTRLVSIIRTRVLRSADAVEAYDDRDFVVILPATKREEARSTIERLKKVVSEVAFGTEDRRILPVVAFGQATYPDAAATAAALIATAVKSVHESN